MKAVILHQHGGLVQIENVPLPVPQRKEVLVKIHSCGCCHTDLHAMDGDWKVKSILPLCPGHEGVGVVHEVGAEVTNLKVGDRVGIAWMNRACGSCEYCISGWETLCDQQVATGFNTDGCLREYAIGHDDYAVKLPNNISFEQAAPILCAGVTSYKAIKEAEVKPGEFLTIVGAAGGLGHLAIQYAKAMGLRVIALDVGKHKADYCLSIGAEFAIDISTTPDVVHTIHQICKGGSHGVLCLATSTNGYNTAVSACRKKGVVVCVGLPKGSFDCNIFDVIIKRLTIRGSIVGTRSDMKEAMDFASRGLVTCTVKVEKLENIQKVFQDMRDNIIEGRVVINM